MANAGRILIIPKGIYDADATYGMLDLVFHNGASWVAKKTVKGIAPSEGEYWQCLVKMPDELSQLGYVHEADVSMSVTYSHSVYGHAVVQRISSEKSNIHMKLQMATSELKDTVSHLFYTESLRSELGAKSVDFTGAIMSIRPHLVSGVVQNQYNFYKLKLDESAFVIYENASGTETAMKMSSDVCKVGTLYDIDIYGAKVTY